MSRPANSGRRKAPLDKSPRVPGWEKKSTQKKVAQAYDDMFTARGSRRYVQHLRGRRVGPSPTLDDYEGSEW